MHAIYTTDITTDKLAVVLQMERYVQLSEEYQLDQVPFAPKVADIRYVGHSRSRFDCEILMIVNCEFL